MDHSNNTSTFAISVGHAAAVDISARVLQTGGNAIDAGVAASIALTVLHSEQVQLGGVVPMIVHLAKANRTYVIEGAGRWPKSADPSLFSSKYQGRIPQGILRTVVPAAVDAWVTALIRFGTKGFAELAEPAMLLAQDGFTASGDILAITERLQSQFRQYSENSKIWLPGGAPVKKGHLFLQPDLANTLHLLIAADRRGAKAEGRLAGLQAVKDIFYKGEIADQIIQHVQSHGGWLSYSDLAEHWTPVVTAKTVPVCGGMLYTCGPWTQGPTLAQALKILECIVRSGPATHHKTAEALKLALADREAYFGDPDFVDVPLDQLFSDSYSATRAALIDTDVAFDGLPLAGRLDSAQDTQSPGQIEGDEDAETVDTSVVAIIDCDGNVFASTPSDPSFDAPVVPGLGFVISTRGSQSYVSPDHPAALEPGKRPRVTACPMLFTDANGQHIAGGGPGGDFQLQAMVQVMAGYLMHGLTLQQAIAAPRLFTSSAPASNEPHFSMPGQLLVEDGFSDDVLKDLALAGHKLVHGKLTQLTRPSVCLVAGKAGGKDLEAHGDHRRESGQRVQIARE